MGKPPIGPWGKPKPPAWVQKLRKLIDRLLDMDGRF
jgi:hypothetical protein